MRTPEGRVVGEHIGLAFYTIGQRKGIGIGGMKGSEGDAWYVAGKDMSANELIVVQGHDHPLLLRGRLTARDLAWVSGAPPRPAQSYGAKTRYRQSDAPCTVHGAGADELDVSFVSPQWAVTPGQSVVLYEGAVCLGGGVIQ
jgi:tRNA-specific 2-thiouridylase